MTRGRCAASRHNATQISSSTFNALPLSILAPSLTACQDPVMRLLAATFLALTLVAALPAFAQEAPPARVVRVSFVAGQLGFQAKGDDDASAAAVNYPVATGGAFWTDPKARAAPPVGSPRVYVPGRARLG